MIWRYRVKVLGKEYKVKIIADTEAEANEKLTKYILSNTIVISSQKEDIDNDFLNTFTKLFK